MALLCKRGVQLAAYFSKSSSCSTSTLCISRSLAESKRVVNNRGRWAFGAVRGYTEDASNSSLSDQIQKKMLQQQEHHISALQLEVEMLRNEMLRNELKKSSERIHFQFEKLRDEIEEKIKEPPSEEELSERTLHLSLSNTSEIGMVIRPIVQLEIQKLRNKIEKKNKESSSSSEKLRSEIDDKVLEDNTAETTYACLRKKGLEQLDHQEIDESAWIYKLAKATIQSALYIWLCTYGFFYSITH